MDYSRHRMILEPNSRLTEPVEFDISGLDIVAESPAFSTFRIRGVVPNSPAAKAGLLERDIINAINGRPAAEFTMDRINGMLKQAGFSLTLTVKRGERISDFKLVLKRSS